MNRFRAFTDLQSRDGTLQRGGRIVNGYVEEVNANTYVQKRPALGSLTSTLGFTGNGLWYDAVKGTGSGGLGLVGVGGTALFTISSSGAGAGTFAISTNGLSLSGYYQLVLGGNVSASSMVAADGFNALAYGYPTPSSSPVTYNVGTATSVHVIDSLGNDYYTNVLAAGDNAVPFGSYQMFVSAGNGDIFVQATANLGLTWERRETYSVGPITGNLGDQIGILGATYYIYNNGLVYSSTTPLTVSTWSYLGATSGLGTTVTFATASDGSYIYAIAGGDSGFTTYTKSVYRTSNGTTFSLVTSSPGWVVNASGSAVAVGTDLYFAAGFDLTGYLFSIWTSADGGSTWSDITPAETPTTIGPSRLTNVNGKAVLMNYDKVYEYTPGSAGGWTVSTLGTVTNPNGVIADFAAAA